MNNKVIGGCLGVLLASTSLEAAVNVLVFAGSTREDSYNKKLAQESATIAEKMGAKVTLIDLKDYPLPFYDADLEAKEGLPKNAKKLRELMIQSNAIIIASPEYNRSLTAILKNTIDWLSRDGKGGSKEAFKGKKFAIMSASPGGYGGKRGLTHLREILEDLGAVVVAKEVSISHAHEYFAKPKEVNPALKEEIQELFKS